MPADTIGGFITSIPNHDLLTPARDMRRGDDNGPLLHHRSEFDFGEEHGRGGRRKKLGGRMECKNQKLFF